jgi:hypothetical protein
VLWINQGGMQGGTVGFFTDGTAARFPAILTDGRDIEFVDIDNDGDRRPLLSNTSRSPTRPTAGGSTSAEPQGGTPASSRTRLRPAG